MNDFFSIFFFWVVPPLLGAFIGYLTNAIAIRMLFRPLTEKKVFGLRLPFTPGIIPRQRYQLAENIAQMVADELLTPQAVRQQLANPSLRIALQENISKVTTKLFSTTLKDLNLLKIDPSLNKDSPLGNELFRILAHSLNFKKVIQFLAQSLIEELAKIKLAPSIQKSKLIEIISFQIGKIFTSEKLVKRIALKINIWFSKQAKEKKALANFLSAPVQEGLSLLLKELYGFLRIVVKNWLSSSKMHKQLQIKGRQFLNDIFAKLNLLQRFFLSLGQYDRTLNEAMPQIVDDFINHLDEILAAEKTDQELLNSFASQLKKLANTSFTEFLKGRKKHLTILIEKLLKSFFTFLHNLAAEQKIAKALNNFLNNNPEITLYDIWQKLFITQANEDPNSNNLVKTQFSETLTQLFCQWLNHFSVSNANLTLAELLDLNAEAKNSFDSQLCQIGITFIEERIKVLLEILDIYNLVVNKINSLGIKEVEKLILTVIARQLKWINFFGAILGALIGMVQVILRLF